MTTTTPPAVAVWGVRYRIPVQVQPFLALPAGRIAWFDTEAEARALLSDLRACAIPAELVRVTGRLHMED